MTVINTDELAQLNTLDQVLLWCIVSIDCANRDSRNPYIADSAAIRAESADYVQWSVTQDDKGGGKFIFSALLPLVNPQPLQDKASILERIWSYSPFEPIQEFDGGITGYGYGIPTLPDWVDTNERLLSYLGILATLITKYARSTKGDEAFWADIKPQYWADVQYKISDSGVGGSMVISGQMSIDWSSYLQGLSLVKCLNPNPLFASDVNCNFPRLDLLWAVADVDLTLPPEEVFPLIPATGGFSVFGDSVEVSGESTAGGLINSYGQIIFNDDGLPDWYLDALNNPQGASFVVSGGVTVGGNTTPQLIESLEVCKEQDPDMADYATKLADRMPI